MPGMRQVNKYNGSDLMKYGVFASKVKKKISLTCNKTKFVLNMLYQSLWADRSSDSN